MGQYDFINAINALIDLMLGFLNALNVLITPYVSLVYLLFSFVLMSIVISVFWKGGRG